MKAGFRTDESDEAGDSLERMQRALIEAWEVGVQLERDGRVKLSRHTGPSPQQGVFRVDQPYKARGFRRDYVGVASSRTADAGEVLAWAFALSEAFAKVSLRVWDERTDK